MKAKIILIILDNQTLRQSSAPLPPGSDSDPLLTLVNARYVYGVTATPKRGDNLEKIIHMLLGPINTRQRIFTAM